MRTKLLAFSCCLMAAFTAQAQDSSSSSYSEKIFKPTTGDITTEVGFNLNNGISLNGGEIRLRKFQSDDKATRLGLHMDYDYNKLEGGSQTTFAVCISPGIEKHFAGTNRLSPYIGAELPLGYRGSKHETGDFITEGGWGMGSHPSNRANFNVGLNGLAGVDYYIAPRFYAGFEIGAGIRFNKYKDVVTTYKHDSNHTIESEGNHSVRFSPFSTRGIRVGFAF